MKVLSAGRKTAYLLSEPMPWKDWMLDIKVGAA